MEERNGVIEETLKKQPFWEHLSDLEKRLVFEKSSLRAFEKNQIIKNSDSSCMGIVIVLSGEIRISMISDEGREITLYRLAENECCITTASCVIKQITFDTVVTAVKKTRLLIIPSAVCADLKEKNIYMRSFIYETETERFSQTIWVIKQLLFKRFDQRLADYLIESCEKNNSCDLKMTQEEIARDINSAREVVARMLKHFEREGFVSVKRGHILVKDLQGLSELL